MRLFRGALFSSLVGLVMAGVVQIKTIYYEFGANLGQHVPQQVLSHLERLDVELLPTSELGITSRPSAEALVLSLGNASLALQHAPLPNDLPFESFRLALLPIDQTQGHGVPLALLAANGLPLSPHTHTNVSFDKNHISYGAVVGSYAALELMGFAFLHPLEPFAPAPRALSLTQLCNSPHAEPRQSSKVNRKLKLLDGNHLQQLGCHLDVVESPYWPERAWHLHTQHPLELTEVLQGHDIPQFGPHGPKCHAFTAARGRPAEQGYALKAREKARTRTRSGSTSGSKARTKAKAKAKTEMAGGELPSIE
jgi:hypothetical protein